MTQHWLSETFRHRRVEPSHQVYFLDDSAAATEDTGTIAVLEVSNGIYRNELRFMWPTEKANLDSAEKMLRIAFEKGGIAAKREIRSALGVTDPRS